MGRISSVIEFTGRTGNLVGVRGENGEFYLRRHVRHVRDASSEQQIITRAKIALAGSLAKLFPADVLYGMSGNGRRGRRHYWMKEIMKRMTISEEGGKVRAELAPEDMVLSNGRYGQSVVVADATIAGGVVTMTVTIPEGVERALVVSAFAESERGRFAAVDSAVATATGQLRIPAPDVKFDVANLYVIPIVRSTMPSGVGYSSEVVAEGEGRISYSAEARKYNSEKYEWMHSVFVGSVTV